MGCCILVLTAACEASECACECESLSWPDPLRTFTHAGAMFRAHCWYQHNLVSYTCDPSCHHSPVQFHMQLGRALAKYLPLHTCPSHCPPPTAWRCPLSKQTHTWPHRPCTCMENKMSCMLIKSPVHTFAQANTAVCCSHAEGVFQVGLGWVGLGLGGSTRWELSGFSRKLLLFMQHLQQWLLLLQPSKNCFIKCFLLASRQLCISNAFMLMSFELEKATKTEDLQRTYTGGKNT